MPTARRRLASSRPTGSRQADSCRLSWMIFSSQGRKRAKSLAARAATHSDCAIEVVRASSSTRVRGRRTRRS